MNQCTGPPRPRPQASTRACGDEPQAHYCLARPAAHAGLNPHGDGDTMSPPPVHLCHRSPMVPWLYEVTPSRPHGGTPACSSAPMPPRVPGFTQARGRTSTVARLRTTMTPRTQHHWRPGSPSPPSWPARARSQSTSTPRHLQSHPHLCHHAPVVTRPRAAPLSYPHDCTPARWSAPMPAQVPRCTRAWTRTFNLAHPHATMAP